MLYDNFEESYSQKTQEETQTASVSGCLRLSKTFWCITRFGKVVENSKKNDSIENLSLYRFQSDSVIYDYFEESYSRRQLARLVICASQKRFRA
ncbi:unnamed protein product [Caenorhabditis nigoni]